MRWPDGVRSVAGMERVEAAMQTPDGYWRVEIVRSGGERWYRVRHANTVVADKAAIATVQRILGDAFERLEAAA
jgi:hypothetical protein